MLSIPRSPLASSAARMSSPRLARPVSTSRPAGLQLLSPTNPALQPYYGKLPSILSPTLFSPPIASPPSPAFTQDVRSPRLPKLPDSYSLSPHTPSIASILSPAKSCLKHNSPRVVPHIDLSPVPASPEKTVTQATFQAAELERREQRPQIKLETGGLLQAPFMSPITPRSGRTPRSTRTPKRVAISPVVLVANQVNTPIALSAVTRRLERLEIRRLPTDEEVAEEDKYTLGMRRGTPVTTPSVERFDDTF